MSMTHREIEHFAQYAANVIHAKQAWLFGSFARGEASADSDVDLLFVIEKMENPRISYIQQVRKALRSWHVAKDILVYEQQEFDEWGEVSGALCHTVKHEGVVLNETR